MWCHQVVRRVDTRLCRPAEQGTVDFSSLWTSIRGSARSVAGILITLPTSLVFKEKLKSTVYIMKLTVCQWNCALTVNHHKWIHFRKCSHASMSIVHLHCYNKVGKWCIVCLPPYILWSRLTTKEVAYRLVSRPDLLCHHSAPLLFWQETSHDNTSKTQRMSIYLEGLISYSLLPLIILEFEITSHLLKSSLMPYSLPNVFISYKMSAITWDIYSRSPVWVS